MENLKKAIYEKEQWEGLEDYIKSLEDNIDSNPNIALDCAKSIIESICKTILNNKGVELRGNEDLAPLAKKTIENLPVFQKLSTKDSNSAKSIVGSLGNISRCIGEFRNNHGFFAHGRDLQSEKFDKYLLNLAIQSCDMLSSFLVISHSEDLKNRSRVYYEDYDLFNKYLDELEDNIPTAFGIQMEPSRFLYSDIEAYKEKLEEFEELKEELIRLIEKESKDINFEELINMKEYFTIDEVTRILECAEKTINSNGEIKNFLVEMYEDNKSLLNDEIKERLKEILEI